MRSGIVVLKGCHIWMILEERLDDRPEFLINVNVSCNVHSEDKKRSTMLVGKSTPYMYASSPVPVVLGNTCIGVSFSRTTPDTNSPISKSQIKSTFIGEHC